ncbi:MAG: membrane protein insertion efficiency factor YidD [Bacilli bacterium]|jgi:putative membrane protein insertion efficiency factor|nr:membrane protein insertion efficiency factor YidD [Bacilli bacterium]
MGRILIFFIRVYQIIPFSSHQFCRHMPTCSNYMIEAIESFGAWKGFWMGLKRINKCRPFGTCGYDPVPKKEEKF